MKEAKEQRFNEANKREKVIQQQNSQNAVNDDIASNLVPIIEEEKNNISLGMAMRRRIRMEVEAQALRAE